MHPNDLSAEIRRSIGKPLLDKPRRGTHLGFANQYLADLFRALAAVHPKGVSRSRTNLDRATKAAWPITPPNTTSQAAPFLQPDRRTGPMQMKLQGWAATCRLARITKR